MRAGAWARGPVAGVSAEQTYLPKGRMAGGEPAAPRPGSRGPASPGLLGQGVESPSAAYAGPRSAGLVVGPPPLSSMALARSSPYTPWLPSSAPSLVPGPLPGSPAPLLRRGLLLANSRPLRLFAASQKDRSGGGRVTAFKLSFSLALQQIEKFRDV